MPPRKRVAFLFKGGDLIMKPNQTKLVDINDLARAMENHGNLEDGPKSFEKTIENGQNEDGFYNPDKK